MRTLCVGRYLVDVPVEARVSIAGERISGFAIDTVEENDAAFRARVKAREADLAARPADPDAEQPGGIVESRDLRMRGMVGRTIIYGRGRTYGFEHGQRVDHTWVSVETHAHLDGLSVALSMKYGSEEDAQLAEALVERLHVRGEDEVPRLLGFCISRAIFVDPLPEQKNEHVTLHLGLPGHPDMGLAFSSMPGGRTDRTLLARVAATDAEAGPEEMLSVTKLRSGKRSINGIHGEEVLERVRELNFTTGYSLMWEAQGREGDPLQPYLLLNMETGTNPRPGGKPVDSSLHEDAVVALWDSISATIRLRKGEPPLADLASEPPGAPLGTLGKAGDTVPQTGWWMCREGGSGINVQGGAKQWLRKGERMPQALLLPRQSLWQKLRGLQPSIEPDQPTTWQLVDKRQRPRVPSLVVLVEPGRGNPEIAAGAMPAVGTHARTGDACPASGWWRCDEAQALDGTRWFSLGSVLPAATFQVAGGMFSRTSGPDTIQRRSDWQLVRLDNAKSAMPGSSSADEGRSMGTAPVASGPVQS